MTTSSLPSAARSQPVTLDVDIELTELTPPAGLPAHSPVNPSGVDLFALQQREEDAFARIFRRKGARPRPATSPPVTEQPGGAAPAPVPDHAPVSPPLLAAGPASAEPLLDQTLAEPPALEEAVIPLAAADAGLPEVTLENADLDAFVHALLASAERDRAMPVDTVPVLEPLHDELPAPALAVEHSLPAVDDDEPLDFAFDELLIAELDSPTDTPASQPPTLAALPEQDAGADALDLQLLAQDAEAPTLTAVSDAPALTTVADDDALALAFNEMLAAADASTPDTTPADADAALEFDLDELLMLDPPVAQTDSTSVSMEVTPVLAEPVAAESADATALSLEDLDVALTPDVAPPPRLPETTPAAEPATAATPLAFDLDDMLMLDAPAATADAPELTDAQPALQAATDDRALEHALDALLTDAPALDLPVLDAPLVDVITHDGEEALAAETPAALAFDLDDMLMFDQPATGDEPVALAAQADVAAAPATAPAHTAVDDASALALTLDELLTVDAAVEASAPAGVQNAAAEPAAEADDAPAAALAFDLDDMLMLDPLPAEDAPLAAEAVFHPVEREALTLDHDDILADALQEMAAAAQADVASLAADASAVPPLDAWHPAEPAVVMPEASTDAATMDVDDALMAELTPEPAEPTDDALDFAFSASAAALADAPSALDEYDAAAARAQADDDLLDPLPVLDALEEPPSPDVPERPAQTEPDADDAPVTAPAATLLDLDLALAAPPLLDALHDDEAPAATEALASTADAAPTRPEPVLPAASVDVTEPAELPLPLLEEEHRAPAAATSRPASHDSDILAMLAQSLEGNWWSMVQGSPAHYSMFRRGLSRLAQRLADLPATGLPALVDALIAQADSLPISGPSAWAAEAVSLALETLGDALLSLPTPSTTQRAAVQARTRELLAGPPPAPVAVEAVPETPVADAPLLALTEEAEPVVLADADAEPGLALADASQVLAAPDAAEPEAAAVADVALTPPSTLADAADAMALPVEPASPGDALAELMTLDLGGDAEVAPLDIPALSLSDALEDAPVWLEEELPPAEDPLLAETVAASPQDVPLAPEALALADGSVPVDPALLDAVDALTENNTLATDEAVASEDDSPEDSPLPAVLDASDDAAALAELDSVQVMDPPPPAAVALVEDDDWTQPPLAELSRLANEAPLASPTPAVDVEPEPEAAPEVLTHWPADEETAALPGFAELPELGRAPEPEPEPEPVLPVVAAAPEAAAAEHPAHGEAEALTAPLETVAEALAAEASTDVAPALAPASERAPLRSITLEDIPHLRQMLGGNNTGSSFPTVAEALAEPETPEPAPAVPVESVETTAAPAFSASIPVSDIPLLRAGTLEALLEKIEPVEEVPAETPVPPAPDVVPLGPTQLAAFFASLEADAPAAPIPAIDLAAFLVVAQGLVQRMVQECRNARSQGIGPGFVSAADELGRSARDAGVPDMANLAAALASALTRPLSPQAVLELATDTVAVLSVMVSQGQRHEPIEGAPDMVAALEALIAKPPVRKLP